MGVFLALEEGDCNILDCTLGNKRLDTLVDKVGEAFFFVVVVEEGEEQVHSILFACMNPGMAKLVES